MGQVKLILREDVPNLGHAGELVSVKPGYARNYLVPRGLATAATASKVRQLEHERRVIEEKLAKQLKDLKAVAIRLEKTVLEVSAKAGEEGKLFGSVTAAQIAELLVAKGFEVDRRRVELGEPIRSLGEHPVAIKLHRDLSTSVKVIVSAEE